MKLSSRLSWRVAIMALAFASFCFAQKDPGVRGGPPGAGGPPQGLAQNERALLEAELRTTCFFHFSFLTISIYGRVLPQSRVEPCATPAGWARLTPRSSGGRGGRSFVTIGPGEPGLLPPFVAWKTGVSRCVFCS